MGVLCGVVCTRGHRRAWACGRTGTESESGRQLLPSEQAGLVCLQSVAAEPEQPTRLLSRRLQAIDASRFRSDTTATAPLPWRVFSTLTSKQNSLPSAVNRLRDKSLSRRWGGGGGQLVGTRAVFNADSAGATRGWRNDTGTPPVQLKLQAVVHALAALQTYVNRRRQATSDLQALWTGGIGTRAYMRRNCRRRKGTSPPNWLWLRSSSSRADRPAEEAGIWPRHLLPGRELRGVGGSQFTARCEVSARRKQCKQLVGLHDVHLCDLTALACYSVPCADVPCRHPPVTVGPIYARVTARALITLP